MRTPAPSVAFRGRYLDLVWDGAAEYVHNRRSRGVVLVIPVTAAGELILLEQQRPALGRAVIEYPAGLVGDEDPTESFPAAARRELREESGYAAGPVEFVLRGPSSPGSSTEVVDFYLARGVVQVDEGGGVGHERIRVHRVPLAGAADWLAEQTLRGVLIDPRVHLGLHLARRAAEAP